MPYSISKRPGVDPSKASPLKMVSPIIKKYAEQRHKRTRISRKTGKKSYIKELKAILPKDGSIVSLEPDLILSVNPSEPSTITVNPVPEEIAQPVQEICAIAKLVRPSRTPRKRSGSSSKQKMIKQGKLVETAFEMLKPDPPNVMHAREQAYAENYLRRVQATFSGKEERTFQQFLAKLAVLETKDANVAVLYKEITELFSGHTDLIEDFVPFLTAEQALECGVLMEYLLSTKMTDFLALVESHFAKSPYQIRKIQAALEKMLSLPEIGTKEICTSILPLLKGNAVLTDFFLELLPSARPPDPLPTDFEELDEEGMSDGSEDGKHEISERLELPNLPDPYGGADCICSCHNVENEKFQTRTQHCIPCSTKFINGKIFIRSGKLLRRATVTFDDNDFEFHQRRLLPHPAEPRKRKRSSCTSPSKSANASSDDHRSDLDEEDKSKLRGRQRTPRSKAKTVVGAGKVECKKDKRLKLNDFEGAIDAVGDSGANSSITSPKPKGKRHNSKEFGPASPLSITNTFMDSRHNLNEHVLSPKGGEKVSKHRWQNLEVVAEDALDMVSFANDLLGCEDKKISDHSSSDAFNQEKMENSVNLNASSVDDATEKPSSFANISSPKQALLKTEAEDAYLNRWQESVPTGGDTVSFINAPDFIIKEEARSPFALNVLSPKQNPFKTSGDEIFKNRWNEVDTDVPTGSDTVSFITLSKDESKAVLAGGTFSPKQLSVKNDTDSSKLENDLGAFKNRLEISAKTQTSIIPVKDEASVDDKIYTHSMICTFTPEPTKSSQMCDGLTAESQNEEMTTETCRLSPPVISIPESSIIPSSIDPLLSVVESSSTVALESNETNEEDISENSEASTVVNSSQDIPWKLEEDRVILHTLQTEKYCEETFVKIGDALPSRSIEGIKKRFQELLNILYKMKAEATE